MVNISDIFNAISQYYSKNELLWFTSSISKFHRVQGCSELEKAVDFIQRNLADFKNFDIKVYKFSYKVPYGIHHDVIGWDVKDGFTQLTTKGRILSSFIRSKTAVATHSPYGDVEAEVVYVGDGLDISRYKGVEDKIILSYGHPYLVYKTGCELGARGFIFFRRYVHEQAVPYVGLFLSQEDVSRCRAPVTTISRKEALNIINSIEKGNKVRVRINVESSFRDNAYAPVVEISLGDGNAEIHMYAHLCHPAEMINDNISGVSALLELVHAIDRGISKNIIKYPTKKRLVFVFFPEYYGSLPYLLRKHEEGSNIEFAINLDMVGEKQWISRSTLYFIRPPQILSRPLYEALVLRCLFYAISKNTTFSSTTKTIAYRFDVTPYDSGSDHDIYLQFGISSIMINQWPDLFYHTDMDTIDKFDPDIASAIAMAVGTAGYSAAIEELDHKTAIKYANSYVDYIHGYQQLKSVDIDERYEHKDVEDNIIYKYCVSKGVITTKFIINRLGVAKTIEIMRVLKDKFVHHLFTEYIPLLTMVKPSSVYDIYRHIVIEYGYRVSIDEVRKLMAYLETLNVISRV